MGLEVVDCNISPLIPNLPQVEAWELEEFDGLLEKERFTIHFHNEQPFLSILDATGSLPQESVRAYLKHRAPLQFYTAPVATPIFRIAQEAFEQALRKERTEPVPHVELFRFPLSIAGQVWNSVAVPDAGMFVPDDPNEGQSHEALLLHVLKPNFDGTVLASPQIREGETTRELCDVLALDENAFLFEAKAFSVFDKSTDQTAERKAATVMKHFAKALGQLQGAAKRLDTGVEIVGEGSSDTQIAGSQFPALHGIIVVSNTSFDLPWLDIGKQLAEAQKPPHQYYHFIPLAEVQRMVAFAKGSPADLHLMFMRRAEVVASSKVARIETDYRPEVTSVLKLPPVSGDCLGLRFVWVGENASDWLLRFFPLVYQQLLKRGFSGRLDFYHKLGAVKGVPAIGIGLAAKNLSEELDQEWWSSFRDELFQSFSHAALPPAAPRTEHIQPLEEITAKYPELLLAVEFQAGFIAAKKAGEEL